jgi:hypothetical protein
MDNEDYRQEYDPQYRPEPKNQMENNAIGYDLYQNPGNDENSLMTKELTQGVLVYYSKTADVKTWVVNDVINTLD